MDENIDFDVLDSLMEGDIVKINLINMSRTSDKIRYHSPSRNFIYKFIGVETRHNYNVYVRVEFDSREEPGLREENMRKRKKEGHLVDVTAENGWKIESVREI